ncbi:MAG: NADPH-dependent oxidoreductase, partial [Proteobacteria bacterium]
SYNRSVFNAYKSLVPAAAELVEIKISDFPLYDGDLEDAQFPETVESAGEKIRSADGILIFSPEYNASIPGVLKNAIDWLSRLDDSPFAGKTAALLSASPGKLGGARMQYHLRQVAVPLDLRIINQPEVMISAAHEQINASGELTNESTLKFLKKHADLFFKRLSDQKSNANS